MQEKDKVCRTWRGFTGSDGITDYTVTLSGDKVTINAKREEPTPIDDPGEDEVQMPVADFKQLVAMAQDLLFEAGDGVMRQEVVRG